MSHSTTDDTPAADGDAPAAGAERGAVDPERSTDRAPTLEEAVQQGEHDPTPPDIKGPPPLRDFGLVLHHDGSWTHEGLPFRNQRLREKFDGAVRYLPDEQAYVVQIGRFRGLTTVEEAGFFVRSLDLDTARIELSDGSEETLDIASLSSSPHDGALLCRIKRDLVPQGLPARFSHSAQADFMNAVDDSGEAVRLGGQTIPLPSL